MKKACVNAAGIDRLSSLPDVPLLCILSFLKARQAVQTCILSKRWRGLWAYIPSIYLDYDEFWDQDGIDQEKFIYFVNSLFILRKISHIDSFRLDWRHPRTSPTIARTWINRVAECKPRLVHMNLSGYECDSRLSGHHFPYLCGHISLKLPQSLFTCTSIEVMLLMLPDYPFKTTIRPRSVFLPCLRSLTLFGVAVDNDFAKNLAQGCPVLDEMLMKGCRLDMSSICSPALTSLIIKDCEVETDMRICTPNLVSLQIEKVESKMIWLRNMPSLLKASLSLCCMEFKSMDKKCTNELLSGLSNASCITLTESAGFAQMRSIFANELPKCPKFKNLRSLFLNACFLCQDFNVIAWFVSLAPNLQKLTLQPRECLMTDFDEDEDSLLKDEDTSKLEVPPQFECGWLKIKIQYWRKENDSKMQELIKTLMENIKTMKKISIHRKRW